MTNQDNAAKPPLRKTDRRIFSPMEHVTEGEGEIMDHVLYADEDVDLLIWWAEPGKTHLGIHTHPQSAHVYFILEGQGEALLGEGNWQPVRPGNVVVNPRGKVHALRNTMSNGRLVFASATAVGAGPHVTIPATEDQE